MRTRMAWSLALICGVLLASALPAAAKTVPMRPVSRAAVDSACARAGGSSFGTRDPDGNYGCSAWRGTVECAADGTCIGQVSDLRRMTGNSLDAVLGTRISGQATRIGPADHRIKRQVEGP